MGSPSLVKVFVHIPLATMHGESVAMVNGYLELAHLPRTGDRVSFASALNERCTISPPLASHAEVECVLLHAGRPVDPPIVLFEPVLVPHAADAPEVLQYFADGFGLWPTPHSSPG